MKFSKVLTSALIVAVVAVTSCKKDDTNSTTAASTDSTVTLQGRPAIEITTIEAGSNKEVVYKKATVTDTAAIVLKQGKAYNVSVKLFDKRNTPINVAAANERFYYTPSGNSSIAVIDLNTDSSNVPVGTTCKWITEVAGSGNINIELKADDATSYVASYSFNTRIQ
ncbi:hypothetical protein [Ferruginibacter albus]|uniref:hypothetical protein n=1 Tax=Ferruginibacter albus TaxID=2875540 RepID=UPI001CC641E8|nr:hypothetical protein [Ferruginibacter albus]UAY51508.1 hypothetical protein K9M53_13040 [Ferruginibacter albus]